MAERFRSSPTGATLFIEAPALAAKTALLIAAAILIMLFDRREHALEPVRKTLSAVVYPLQWAVDAPFALGRWAAPRSTQAFLWAVLGGMTLRLTLVGASVALAIVAMEVPAPALAVSLLGYFTVFLILELVILGRRMPVPEGATR